eukprot:525181-Hanusia_phi.AAC.1
MTDRIGLLSPGSDSLRRASRECSSELISEQAQEDPGVQFESEASQLAPGQAGPLKPEGHGSQASTRKVAHGQLYAESEFQQLSEVS